MICTTTYTVQPNSWTAVLNTEKTIKIKPEENTCDILSVCDSLNKLCEALNRLEYAVIKKNMEKNLNQQGVLK